MKTKAKKCIGILICLMLCFNLSVYAYNYQSEAEVDKICDDTDSYTSFTLRVGEVSYDSTTGDISFKNASLYENGLKDNNTYVINSDTILPSNQAEGIIDLTRLIEGKATDISLAIPVADFWDSGYVQDKTVNVSAVNFVREADTKVVVFKVPRGRFGNLKKFSVVPTDDSGRYQLDVGVTRAQMAQYIANLFRIGDITPVDTSYEGFLDVPGSHPNFEAVSTLTARGVISAGTLFRPDDKISSDEAVKMIVCSLGYDDLAKERGGYPEGYRQVAADLEGRWSELISSGEGFSFRDAAKLLDYAISIPLRAKISYEFWNENWAKYVIMDGENGNPSKSIYDILIVGFEPEITIIP